MTIATAPADPRLAERLSALAADSRSRQLAPPFLGDEPGITRRRFASPTPVNTWTATRIDTTGGIVSQLGSKPSNAFNFATTRAGYQIEQRVQPGYHVWTASVRVIAVSRLPATRTAVSGLFSASGDPTADVQTLVPGRTQLFARVLSLSQETTVRLRWAVFLSMVFDAGQSSYAEGIVQVQSIVHHAPPSPVEPAAAALAAGPPAGRLDDEEVEVISGAEDEVERSGGFDD